MEVDVENTTHNRPESIVIELETRRQEARRGPKGVQKFRKGKGVSKEEESIMCEDMLKAFPHDFQKVDLVN